MTELKPCPFCGGEAVLDKYPVHGYEPAISFEVRCSICGQRRVDGYFDTVYNSEKWARKKAIEAWNARPKPWNIGIPAYHQRKGSVALQKIDEYEEDCK